MEKGAGMIVAGGLCLVLSYYDLMSKDIINRNFGPDPRMNRYYGDSVTLQDIVAITPAGRAVSIPSGEEIFVTWQSSSAPQKGDTLHVCVGEHETGTVVLDPLVNIAPMFSHAEIAARRNKGWGMRWAAFNPNPGPHVTCNVEPGPSAYVPPNSAAE